MSENKTIITAEIVEKDIVTIEQVEKDIATVEIKTIDMIPRASHIVDIEEFDIDGASERDVLVYDSATEKYATKSLTELIEYYLKIEEPTKVTARKFKTSQKMVSGTLQVWLNGIEEKYITVIDSRNFKFLFDLDSDDIVRVKYIRQ